MPPRSRATGRSQADRRPPAGDGRVAVGNGAGRAGLVSGQRERLRAVVAAVVAAAGYDLEELAVSRAGRRHLVRVVVDGDGGTSLDAIAEVSRAVSAALDAAEETDGELFAGEYQLEVSSPGVDRPLTLPRHWRRNVGRLVSVRVAGRQVTGRVVAADEAGVRLSPSGSGHQTGPAGSAGPARSAGQAVSADHMVSYAELGPGRVQVELTRLAELADDDDPDHGGDLDEIDGVHDDVIGDRGAAGAGRGPGGTFDDSDDEERFDDEEREDEER